MTQLQVTLPPDLEQWIDTRLAEGRYVDAAEYVRDLVRRDERLERGNQELGSVSWSI